MSEEVCVGLFLVRVICMDAGVLCRFANGILPETVRVYVPDAPQRRVASLAKCLFWTLFIGDS